MSHLHPAHAAVIHRDLVWIWPLDCIPLLPVSLLSSFWFVLHWYIGLDQTNIAEWRLLSLVVSSLALRWHRSWLLTVSFCCSWIKRISCDSGLIFAVFLGVCHLSHVVGRRGLRDYFPSTVIGWLMGSLGITLLKKVHHISPSQEKQNPRSS